MSVQKKVLNFNFGSVLNNKRNNLHDVASQVKSRKAGFLSVTASSSRGIIF